MSIIDTYFDNKFKPREQKIKREFQAKLKESQKEITKINQKLVEGTPDNDDHLWHPLTIGDYMVDNYSANRYVREYMEWVYANVNTVAEAVSAVQLHLYRVKEDESEEIDEHPLLDLLFRPNPYMTKSNFIFLLAANELLSGEAPIRMRRKNPKNLKETPFELYPWDPSKLKIFVGTTKDGYEILQKYQYVIGNETKDLNPWEIIMLKNMNPENYWRGLGVIEAASKTIDILNMSEQYNLNFFKNSAIPYTILYTDQKLNQETLDRLKNNWSSNYKGINNNYKTAVLEAGLKVERLQSSAKDMDFLEQQRFMRDKLMAMFKTTKIALGIVEDVNRANAEASEYVFMKNCVKPKMQALVDQLNEFLVPLFDEKGELFLDFDDPVPQNRTEIVNEYSIAVDKWMTKNEVRELEGLEPLEGGDVIYQPINLQPLGTELPASPAPADTPNTPSDSPSEKPKPNEENPSEPIKYVAIRKIKDNKKRDHREQIAKLKNRNVRIKQLTAEFRIALKQIILSKKKPILQVKETPKYTGGVESKDMIDLYVKSLLSNSDKFETKFKNDMSKLYSEQQSEVIENLKNKKSILGVVGKVKHIQKKVGDEFMFDKDKAVKSGIDLFTPLMETIIATQGNEALDFVGITSPYSLLDDARKYLNAQPIKLSKTVNDTAYERIRSSLADGLKNGESLDKLIKRVNEEYKDLDKFQAENIARTEVSRATNFATVDAYKQSEVVQGKKWVVAPDDRLCEFCMAMESIYEAKLGLDENYFKIGDTVTGTEGGIFTVSYDNVEAPPLHPQCRCVAVAITKPIKSAVPVNKTAEDLLKEVDEELNAIRKRETA